MAGTTPSLPTIQSIKALAESPGLNSIPSSYIANPDPGNDLLCSDPETNLPVIDYSLLVSPASRSETVLRLGRACEDWGFFMVINHGVPESLMESMIEACRRFFELTEEEKQEYQGKHVLDPIRCGTSFNSSVEKVFFWKDFLKVVVHPAFHSPTKPSGFREACLEYSTKVREVAREILKGISQSLGLEENHIEEEVNLEEGLQVIAANMYPPCPQPELALGMPPHSDHGLLTLLIQNGISGLQLHHKGKWVNVQALPNSFLVHTGDHLEILSNGKYKSVLHRAVVNSKATRISIATPHGPSLDSVVRPAPKLLLDPERRAPAYAGIKYRDYLLLQQSNNLHAKSCLDGLRI